MWVDLDSWMVTWPCGVLLYRFGCMNLRLVLHEVWCMHGLGCNLQFVLLLFWFTCLIWPSNFCYWLAGWRAYNIICFKFRTILFKILSLYFFLQNRLCLLPILPFSLFWQGNGSKDFKLFITKYLNRTCKLKCSLQTWVEGLTNIASGWLEFLNV